MKVKYSIVIPAFKSLFLKDAIRSVLSQKESNFELIVLNDNSPYDLDTIIAEFNDIRIKYYKNSANTGAINVVDNWNKCLSLASGDYLICMGDDDILMPNCLSDYNLLIDKYPELGIYHTWTQIIGEDSEFVNITASRIEYESVYSFLWHRWDNRKQQFIGDFLFNVKILKSNGGFFKLPLAWGSDDISSVIAASFKGIANTSSIGFCYRVNTHTISNSNNAELKFKAIELEEKWYDDFLSVEPVSYYDRLFWKCILKDKKNHFLGKKAMTIANDLKSHNVLRLLYWIKRVNKYQLSFRLLFFSLLKSLK